MDWIDLAKVNEPSGSIKCRASQEGLSSMKLVINTRDIRKVKIQVQ
jgi:hypothetical protein